MSGAVAPLRGGAAGSAFGCGRTGSGDGAGGALFWTFEFWIVIGGGAAVPLLLRLATHVKDPVTIAPTTPAIAAMTATLTELFICQLSGSDYMRAPPLNKCS